MILRKMSSSGVLLSIRRVHILSIDQSLFISVAIAKSYDSPLLEYIVFSAGKML